MIKLRKREIASAGMAYSLTKSAELRCINLESDFNKFTSVVKFFLSELESFLTTYTNSLKKLLIPSKRGLKIICIRLRTSALSTHAFRFGKLLYKPYSR